MGEIMKDKEIRIYFNGVCWDNAYPRDKKEALEWKKDIENKEVSIWDRVNGDALEQFIEEFHILDPEKIEVTVELSYYENLKLFARVIEGSYEMGGDMSNTVYCQPCSQEGFNRLYAQGKKMWDDGNLSKYEIAAFDENNMPFWQHRPDKYNFETYGRYANKFDEMIAEEYEATHHEDFLHDTLEMDWLKQNQKLWAEIFKSENYIDQLAMEIDQCVYDLDTYNYQDAYDTREEGLQDTKDCLIHDPKSLIKELNEYLEEMDETDVQTINEIECLLTQIDTFDKFKNGQCLSLEKQIADVKDRNTNKLVDNKNLVGMMK